MKIGDYVRFDYHRVSTPIQIAKITETHYDNEDDSICYSTDIGLVIDESNLVKEPSPNIIDLIEVGDIVYVDISPDDCGGIIVPRIAETERELNSLKLLIENKDYILKSIITHEQIESMEYKVKE